MRRVLHARLDVHAAAAGMRWNRTVDDAVRAANHLIFAHKGWIQPLRASRAAGLMSPRRIPPAFRRAA